MTDVTVTLDGIYGDVKITIVRPDDRQVLKFRWYKADDESTGFTSSVSESPIPVTELAAEMMIKIILAGVSRVVNIDPKAAKIFNHLGEQLKDIEFMPPTFSGKEADIQKFVARQDSLKNLYSSYEEDHLLTTELLQACEQVDVLEDFLSLVQFQLTRVAFTFSNPKE